MGKGENRGLCQNSLLLQIEILDAGNLPLRMYRLSDSKGCQEISGFHSLVTLFRDVLT